MTPYPTQDAEAIRRGYEQYAPPPVGDFFVGTVVLHDPHDALLTQAPDPGGVSLP